MPCVHIFAVWFARTAATPPQKIGKISICYYYKGRGGGALSVIFGFKATEWRGKKLWSSKLRREREITFFLAAGAVKKNLIKQDLKLYPKKITSSFIHYFFKPTD